MWYRQNSLNAKLLIYNLMLYNYTVFGNIKQSAIRALYEYRIPNRNMSLLLNLRWPTCHALRIAPVISSSTQNLWVRGLSIIRTRGNLFRDNKCEYPVSPTVFVISCCEEPSSISGISVDKVVILMCLFI